MPIVQPIIVPFEGDAKNLEAKIDALNRDFDKFAAHTKTASVASTQAAKTASMSWTDFRSMYSTVLDVVRVGQQVWAATGQEFVNLAENVKNLSRNIGVSAEDASRLIQVSDDVRISYASMSTAMKIAQKQGIDVSISGLEKLADKYQSLPPGIERTQFLMKTFGKSGMEMGKLLEKGGEGVRKMSQAVDENLIITEEGIKASDAYQASLDDFEDTVTALKISIGAGLVPVMDNLLKMATADVQAIGDLDGAFLALKDGGLKGFGDWSAKIIGNNMPKWFTDLGFGVKGYSNEVEDAAQNTQDFSSSTDDSADALETQKEAIQAAKDALKDYEDMLDAVSQANLDMEDMSRTIAKDQRQYEKDHADAIKDVQDARDELAEAEEKASDKSRQNSQNIIIKQKALNEAIKEHGRSSNEAAKARLALDKAMSASNGDEGIAKATEGLAEAEQAVKDLEVEWHESANNMIYDMILVGVSAGGLLDSEQKALDEYAVKAGIKTQADIDEANRRREIADATIAGILQSEDVLAEQKKVDTETQRLTDAVTSAEKLAAMAEEEAAMGRVSSATQLEILNQQRLAEAARTTAREYSSINYGGGGSSGGSSGGNTTGGNHAGGGGRDSGGFGVAGVEYMIGTGAQPERFTPSTNGYFTPNADKKGAGGATTIIINNPKREAAEDSVRRVARRMSYLGVSA